MYSWAAAVKFVYSYVTEFSANSKEIWVSGITRSKYIGNIEISK